MIKCVVFLLFVSCFVSSELNQTWLQNVRIRRQSDSKKCLLPLYPKNGQYTVGGQSSGQPGELYDAVQLLISCHPGYQLLGSNSTICYSGIWSQDMPQCVRHCKLDPHPSVTYHCLVNPEDSEDGYYRICKQHEPSGRIVKPACNKPNYYFPGGILPNMRCKDEGGWTYVATCFPECGTITPKGQPYIIEGRQVERGEFPWHAGIYLKSISRIKPFKLICGGSLVSSTIVISAAHCFYHHDKPRPASSFAIALGKVHREWDSQLDDEVQKFDVVDVKIPVRYQSSSANYQDDIAAAMLSAPAQFRPHVRPVCLDVDPIFNGYQLRDGNLGKVAGWGLIDSQGTISPVLKVLELPYVKIETCIEEAPSEFKAFITSDKICAGYQNGSAICQGDSGGGLVFPAVVHATERYYLRGIVSTAPLSDDACNAFARTTFTQIIKHSAFIEKNNILFDHSSAPVNEEAETLCTLPPYPANGRYQLSGSPGALPGQSYRSAQLRVTCDVGYRLETYVSPSCSDGRWHEDMPKCVKVPEDCGQIPPSGEQLILDGSLAKREQLPWYAGIYRKTTTPYRQICGGSLVSTTVVISVAHCFWSDVKKLLPAQDYAVAVGKLYQPWAHNRDVDAQKSDVSDIKIPKLFQGAAANFQDDIAILTLSTAIVYKTYVRPVCVDFDFNFDRKQLQGGNVGKVAGWGLTPVLKVVDMSYVEIDECLAQSPPSFREYITSDKMCAGFPNGTALCRGDSGGGLAFPESDRGIVRYYLRGVASAAPTDKDACYASTPIAFTRVIKHEHFIKEWAKP